MKNLTRALLPVFAAAIISCDPVDDNGVPESLSVSLDDTNVALGQLVQVDDYLFSFDIQYRKDLVVSFQPEDGSVTYEDQLIEGSRNGMSTVVLDAQTHSTLVTLSRANNGTEVFSFWVNGPFNREEAEEAIEDLSSSFAQDIIAMLQSDGINAIQNLADLGTLEGRSEGLQDIQGLPQLKQKGWQGLNLKQNFRQKATDWKAVFDVRNNPQLQKHFRGEDDGLEEVRGLLEWDADAQDFVLADEAWDYLEVRFPTDGSATNNATLRVTELYYADEETDGTDDIIRVEADLTVDGTAVIDASLRAWSSDVQSGYTADLFLSPFTMSSAASVDLIALTAQFEETLSLNDEVLLGSAFSAELALDQYGDPWPTQVTATQRVRELGVEAVVDVTLAEAWDGESNPDAFVEGTMTLAEQYLGDIYWEKTFIEEWETEEWYPYLLLPNDEVVDVVSLLEDEVQEVEAIFVAALENWFN
ncbi:MAG TPA: hypothetical protein DCE41_20960 [Cytophagales bacterium]|nr:hypothetical protein [Cytophagales bacterium]HAA23540.1 hypothetical protein [Cytophagales bacterium]HAP59550.1 hypothetical protein [Cytophagales bacterium]